MSAAISLPFNFTEYGALQTSQDSAKIWQDRVILSVMTGLGQRVMRPTFGSNVNKAVGENINDAMSLIRQSIEVTFSQWLDELSLLQVTGYIDPYDDYLVIQIKYNYRAQNLLQTLNIKTAILNRSGEILLEVSQYGK